MPIIHAPSVLGACDTLSNRIRRGRSCRRGLVLSSTCLGVYNIYFHHNRIAHVPFWHLFMHQHGLGPSSSFQASLIFHVHSKTTSPRFAQLLHVPSIFSFVAHAFFQITLLLVPCVLTLVSSSANNELWYCVS